MFDGALIIGIPEFAALIIAAGIVGVLLYRLVIGPASHNNKQRNENAKDAERDDFSTILSKMKHNFREPIDIVIGMATKMEADARNELNAEKIVDNAKFKDYVTGVHSNATTVTNKSRQLQALINRVTEHAKTKDPKFVELLKLDFEPLSMKEIIEGSVKGLEEQYDISIDRDLSENVPLVKGEKNVLMTIMDNLLENAVKYSGIPKVVSVALTYSQNDKKVICEVKDCGIGILREHKDNIFEEGFRIGDSNVPGSGLGLPIVKQYVELHDGTIEVDSNHGEGSTFRIYLPCGT